MLMVDVLQQNYVLVNDVIYMYVLFFLLYISAKRKQDIFWKISIAANVLYYVSQVSELIYWIVHYVDSQLNLANCFGIETVIVTY